MEHHVFPVGTKVRCVQAGRSACKLVKGRGYTVQAVADSGNVRLYGVPDIYWQPTRFVPVQQVIRVNARKGVVKRVMNWLRGAA